MTSMEHNLVPPFIMREAGLIVNDIPKIQCIDPGIEDHSIYSREDDLRIPLKLRGVFSYFTTRKLSQEEISYSEAYDIVFFTPDSEHWDPHCDSYADREDSYLDDFGEMRLPRDRVPVSLLTDADLGSLYTKEVEVNKVEEFVDEVLVSSVCAERQEVVTQGDIVCFHEDQGLAHIADVSAVYDPDAFSMLIQERAAMSKFAEAAGCTHVNDDGCILFEAKDACAQQDEQVVGEVSAVLKRPPRGVTAEHLSKVWRVDHATAQRTLETTTQLRPQDGNSSLARNFGTNDRMLRYRRLSSFFYTDTLFVTKKAKSSRQNTCLHLFVSDKRFVFLVPMTSTKEFPDAIRMFAKEVGVPVGLLVDPHRSQMSKEVKQFLNKIGTTLRIIKESTQWANRAELYIGILKEAVRKDMHETHSPLVLWDYCSERCGLIVNMTPKDLFQLQGQTPHTATFGTEGDISNICQFSWYE